MGTPEVNGVLSGLACEFIDEALDREHIVVRSDSAPEGGVDARRLFPVDLHANIRDVVGDVFRGSDSVPSHAVSQYWRRPPGEYRRSGHAMFPGDDAIAVQ